MPPGFELIILLLQLLPHRAKPQLRVDPRAQHRLVDRLGHKIVRARFQAKHFAFFPAMAGQHDRGQLRDRGSASGAQLLQHFRAIDPGHVEIEQEERRRIGVQHLQRFDARPATLRQVNPAATACARAVGGSSRSSSATRIRSPLLFVMFSFDSETDRSRNCIFRPLAKIGRWTHSD